MSSSKQSGDTMCLDRGWRIGSGDPYILEISRENDTSIRNDVALGGQRAFEPALRSRGNFDSDMDDSEERVDLCDARPSIPLLADALMVAWRMARISSIERREPTISARRPDGDLSERQFSRPKRVGVCISQRQSVCRGAGTGYRVVRDVGCGSTVHGWIAQCSV